MFSKYQHNGLNDCSKDWGVFSEQILLLDYLFSPIVAFLFPLSTIVSPIDLEKITHMIIHLLII